MEGAPCVQRVCETSGAAAPAETEHSQPKGFTPDVTGDSGMSRYQDIALRLAVVAAFVLVLAAPLRW